MEYHSKRRRDLIYRADLADTFEADIVFPAQLISELKALRKVLAPDHVTQLLSYMKFWRIRTGMLFDIGEPSLISKRMIYTSRTGSFPDVPVPKFVTDRQLARKLRAIAGQCLADIGFGYRETTWSGLMAAAFRAEPIPFTVNPTVTVPKTGESSLRCFVFNDQAPLPSLRWGRRSPPWTARACKPAFAGTTCRGASVFISAS